MLNQTRGQNRIYLNREKLPILIGYEAVLGKQIVHPLGHCTKTTQSKADTRGRKKTRQSCMPAQTRGSHHRLPVALWSCLGQNLRPLQPETEPEASQGTPSCLVSRAKKKNQTLEVSFTKRLTHNHTKSMCVCAAIMSWRCFFTHTKQGISRYLNCQCFSTGLWWSKLWQHSHQIKNCSYYWGCFISIPKASFQFPVVW